MNPYLHRLILEGEHQQLDFKVEISDSRKIARSMVAFANATGGRLLIGVKDGGGIAGVRSDEEIYMLKIAVTKFCKPRLQFEVRKWQSGKKMVVEVIIPEGNRKPYFCLEEDERWKAYIRVKDQNILVEKIVLKVWERQKQAAATLVRYSHVEEWLVQHLELHPSINSAAFSHMAGIPPFVAEKVLVNLTCMNLLQMTIDEHGTFFSINKEGFQDY
ncbi:MAG TPA: ATP-binding protein [Bacteroidales bacterium]|nr:ATP-binding protein [Bacteroidales bacterium]HSA42183.1 ATP-binding protein [Bacteroidales bacterium]